MKVPKYPRIYLSDARYRQIATMAFNSGRTMNQVAEELFSLADKHLKS